MTRLLPYGPDALLVEVDDTAAAVELAAIVRARHGHEVREIVPGARTVLLDGLAATSGDLRDFLRAWRPGETASGPPGPEVRIPVVYDGADLADVAVRWGTDVDGVVERHTATVFTAAFSGFAPGFAYLTGLPDDLAVARLDRPRPRVPAGSVGLAGPWCGVYPRASPGGWRLLGRTDVVLFDPRADPPARIAPGTRVRFEAR